jgi:hypothetical protein
MAVGEEPPQEEPPQDPGSLGFALSVRREALDSVLAAGHVALARSSLTATEWSSSSTPTASSEA